MDRDKKDRIMGYGALAAVALAFLVATITANAYGFRGIGSFGFGLAAALLTFVSVDVAFTIYYKVSE